MEGWSAARTRREALRDIGVAGLGLAAYSGAGAFGDLVARAAAAGPRHGSLRDIEHVVILMQENRSFDHYFGTLSGVRGFSDPNIGRQSVGGKGYPIFDQFGYQPGKGADPSGYLQPFRLYSDPPLRDGQTTNDISHTW